MGQREDPYSQGGCSFLSEFHAPTDYKADTHVWQNGQEVTRKAGEHSDMVGLKNRQARCSRNTDTT